MKLSKLILIILISFTVFGGGSGITGVLTNAKMANLKTGDFLFLSSKNIWGLKTATRTLGVNNYQTVEKYLDLSLEVSSYYQRLVTSFGDDMAKVKLFDKYNEKELYPFLTEDFLYVDNFDELDSI